MDFTAYTEGDCPHQASVDVAAALREVIRELYAGQFMRAAELEGTLPNMVLAGLTLAWLESAHAVFGTADYESAITLLRGIQPDDEVITREMRQAARDILRRSKWLPRKRRTK
jgi:predicted RNA-binding Zn ribbon-like protein